jgi:hypothetical protein
MNARRGGSAEGRGPFASAPFLERTVDLGMIPALRGINPGLIAVK